MKKHPIGFKYEADKKSADSTEITAVPANKTVPHKSLVDIYFPQRDMTLSYYNDSFDLHEGDIVYVDGKLEGKCGRVVSVNYSFKIKLSDYKRVIAVVDTRVSGDIYLAGSHIVTFDPCAMPYEKVLAWFKAPEGGDAEYVSGEGEEGFPLENIPVENFSSVALDAGGKCYKENNVAYIEVNKTHGRAVVIGSKAYELEFEYSEGNISDLVCSCYCNSFCKHEFAAMLQLRETLGFISDNYSSLYTNYFAAMFRGDFFKFTVSAKNTGKITLY